MPVEFGHVYDVPGTSINSEGVLIAADASKLYVIRKAALEVTGGGAVVFKDGAGGTTIATVYLAATTRTTIGDETWGPAGKRLTKGNALVATLSGQTCNGQVIADVES